ncbi:MAG: hypothetical protein M1832_002953 [Thelocarpon impressellum]|nr:MAG: hypothetical protein M1832_002953 [Thelocarpon impressellum]
MAETLEDRLKGHAQAFDGLLSLIPAKLYYGEDTTGQWQKKKQTKEESKRAKMAKLDPDSARSAKDVLDERARKRKREDDDGSEGEGVEGVEAEKPKQGWKAAKKLTKKQKKEDKRKEKQEKVQTDGTKEAGQAQKDDRRMEKAGAQRLEPTTQKPASDDADALAAAKEAKAEKRKEKAERKKEKLAAKAERKQTKKASKDEAAEAHHAVDTRHDPTDPEAAEIEPIIVTGLADDIPRSSVSPSPPVDSPVFDAAAHSGASSTSSVVPPTKRIIPKEALVDSEALRARLQARIEALRASRKADGLNGAPARNRSELLEARRLKEEERRAHKKELRAKAKAEEMEARERKLKALHSPDFISPPPATAAVIENNFSFGKIAFGDGQQMDPSLSTLLDSRKRKGPQDPLGALKAADNKRARLSGLDEEKRKDIEEKDSWLNARKRAHGERIRDDTSLLKKSLKRKEKAKEKSGKEWRERLENVEKGQEVRQKKREDNLRKRREEKGGKGKGKKPQNRPGFEGSFRSRPRRT